MFSYRLLLQKRKTKQKKRVYVKHLEREMCQQENFLLRYIFFSIRNLLKGLLPKIF